MLTSRKLVESMGGPATLRQLTDEVWELIEAILKLDLPNIKEEASDVAWFFWALLGQKGINLPAIGAEFAWRKFTARMFVWLDIFIAEGILPEGSTLEDLLTLKAAFAEGSNYKRPDKLKRVVNIARELSRQGR